MLAAIGGFKQVARNAQALNEDVLGSLESDVGVGDWGSWGVGELGR